VEKDRFHTAVSESLKEEVADIKMSSLLKESIKKNTVKNKSLYRKFRDLMNTTIEIPVPSAVAVCVLICLFTFSTFRVTESMKKDKSIRGYTSVRIIRVGNMDILIDIENGGMSNEQENKS